MSANERAISLAKEEVGYLEKKTSDYTYLYSKEKNAGSNNYTKYNYELAKTDIFNGSKFGYQWCTSFYIWIFYHLWGAELTKKCLYLPSKSLAAGCVYAVKYYKSAGKYGSTPQLGAQIFFKDSDGDPCHTGIVIGFNSTTVWTIEGNTSSSSSETIISNGGGVFQRSYSRSNSRIHGYGYPNWSVLESFSEGWQKSNGKWWYRYKDGSYPVNQFKEIDGYWYYFDKEGYLVTNTTWTYNNTTYKADNNGHIEIISNSSASNNSEEGFNVAKQYKNKNSIEYVYADTSLKTKVGSLDPNESCECLAIVNGKYLVKYRLNGTSEYKTGFVKYSGGVS